MNHPGVLSSKNWTWRAQEGFTNNTLARKIAAATHRYGRAK